MPCLILGACVHSIVPSGRRITFATLKMVPHLPHTASAKKIAGSCRPDACGSGWHAFTSVRACPGLRRIQYRSLRWGSVTFTGKSHAQLGRCSSCAPSAPTYRDAAGLGPDGSACAEIAMAAYLTAGGQYGAERAARDMITSLSREHGDRFLHIACPLSFTATSCA